MEKLYRVAKDKYDVDGDYEKFKKVEEAYYSRGDLLRSVPFIMWGHLNIEFFQTSAVLILTRNPKSTCLMMILSHSGQAPKSFLHLLHDMSHHEMSPHDTKQ